MYKNSIEQFNLIQALVANGEDINIPIGDSGSSPFKELCSAMPIVTIEMLAFCKQYGADMNYKNYNNYTPFHSICFNLEFNAATSEFNTNSKYELIKYCVEEMGARFDVKTSSGSTPFSLLCGEMLILDPPLLKYCVDKGCNFSEHSIEGYTAFHWICALSWRNGFNMDTLRFCVENGGDLNARNRFGQTPFMWICYYSNYCMTNEMLDYCINIAHADPHIMTQSGETPQSFLLKNMQIKMNQVTEKLAVM